MSSFRVAPHQGHFEHLKRMYCYLKQNPAGATRFCVKIPNHEAIATPIQ
jgi:hypothetical protein